MIVSFFKQPSILAYILVGLILGPFGYYGLHQGDTLNGLAQIGITLLLFMVGLELDVAQVKRLGKTALVAGLGQILFTSLIGFTLVRALGFSAVPAAYIAIALTFSSTIVVVKLLGEKHDLQSLYAKISIGIFLVQDFAAIFVLIFLTGNSGSAGNSFTSLPGWQNIILTLTKGLILVLFIMWQSRKVFPFILKHIGKSDELLLIFSLAWALGFSAFVSLPFIGFSLSVGGFLAGIALASTSVHHEISARIKSLRDFFIIIFFIVMGSQLAFGNLSAILKPALILSGFVLIGNPFIVLLLLGLLGYKPRTAFFSAITFGQVSEFSFILITLAYSLGYVDKTAVSLVTLSGLITIALSAYAILYAHKIYDWLKPLLLLFDFGKGRAEKNLENLALSDHIILVGAHRLGRHLIDTLSKQKQPFVIVDHNPEIIEHYAKNKIPGICGDITDPYIQELAGVGSAKLIVSTVPDLRDNLALSEAAKHSGSKAKLIFTAQDEEEALLLYEKKIDYALLPHFIGGIHLARLLEEDHDFKNLSALRNKHLKMLTAK